MRTTEAHKVCVRRDVDLSDLVGRYQLSSNNPELGDFLVQQYGGHYLKYSIHYHRPGELRECFVPKATKVCLDYQVIFESGHRPIGCGFPHDPVSTEAEMVLVLPEEDWVHRDVLTYMENKRLRSASLYEHLAYVHAQPDEVADRTLVPFGGYPNPGRWACTGLLLAHKRRVWWSEGGCDYANGTRKRARYVAFTATRTTS